MPSRKQRRRRQKLQRHEYEYVVETEEGEEVPVERLRDVDRPRADGGKNGSRGEPTVTDRRGRPMEKPSLRRVLRRAAIFGPLLFVFVYIAGGKDLTVAGMVFQTAILLGFFIPFSYLVDTMVYRTMLRRAERERAAKRARR